ncbi:MAG: hypothetical protein ACOC7U_05580 [Spirochaetota bacterium]
MAQEKIKTRLAVFGSRLWQALRKESWSSTVLKLAWTAGPVTYLALQAGYIMGYGQHAPKDLFIYFASYTVVAGIFPVLARFIYNITRGKEIEENKKKLSLVINRLLDLIALVRNENLANQSLEERLLLGTKLLLQNPSASEAEIRTALEDLAGSNSLSRAIERIETFRKNGMWVRVQDEYEKISQKLAKTVSEIEKKSVEVASLVRERFRGNPPTTRKGLSRTEGFIERIFSAGEENNFELMNLTDAEELFILFVELLNGREIPQLSDRYIGSPVFQKVSSELEKARREYRTAAYIRNSRLRQLALVLRKSEYVRQIPAVLPPVAPAPQLYSKVLKAMEKVRKELEGAATGSIFRKTRTTDTVAQEFIIFKKAVSFYRYLLRSNQALARKYDELKKAGDRYRRLFSRKELPLKILSPGMSGPGIRIVERKISLSENSSQQIGVRAYHLLKHALAETSPESSSNGLPWVFDYNLSSEDYKNTAVELAHLLDQHINLYRPETRYAIESSNAPNLAALGTGLTAGTRARWAARMVQDVEDNVQQTAQRLIRNLVQYHGARLTEQSVHYLSEHYGIPFEFFSQLEPGLSAPAPPQGQLLSVQPLDRSYTQLIDRLQPGILSRKR